MDGDGVPGLQDATAIEPSQVDAVPTARPSGRDRAKDRMAGVLRLRALDAVAPAAREGDLLPLLRVPLLIEDRDAVALQLRRRGINVFFVYAPPLDDYSGPEFCELSRRPDAGRSIAIRARKPWVMEIYTRIKQKSNTYNVKPVMEHRRSCRKPKR